MSYLTSLTIGGTEWISKLQNDDTEYGAELGGQIATATFVVQDVAANINAITGRPEVIAYIGTEKVWGGYAAVYDKILTAPAAGILKLTIQCQDYAVLMDRAVVTAEEVYSGTDEAALDDLFTSYCSSISTTPVNQVVADLEGLTIKVGTSVRKAVEMIAERSGAEWYVTPDKTLEYFDPASDAPDAPFWLRESPATALDTETFSGWTEVRASYDAAAQTLTEDSTAAQQHYIWTTATIVSGEEHFIFADVKAGTRTWMNIETQLTGAWKGASFNLSAGAVGTVDSPLSSGILALGGGWYRCFVWGTSGTTSAGAGVWIGEADDDIVFDGDGSSLVYLRQFRMADGHPILAESFAHEIDAATLANDITVRAGEDGSVTVDIPCEETASDGHVYKTGGVWPPDSAATADTSADPNYLRSGHDGATYRYQVVLMKFDTSTLPDTATITAAAIHVNTAGALATASGDGIGIEYYSAANWPIGSGDYTATPSNSAYGYTDPASLPDESEYVFDLTSPDSNISKTGETGFRWHYKFTGTPAGSDEFVMSIRSVDGAVSKPFIRITYTDEAAQDNDTDATSIAAYGTQKITIVDTSIESDAEASLRTAVELAKRKDPMEYGSLEIREDGVSIGDLVHIESASYDVDDDFLVRDISTAWPGGICTHTIDYGDHKPDLTRLMRLLAAAKEE